MDYPGEKLLIKLWETIAEKGIGSLLTPWQISREGRARNEVRREELLMLAQAKKDADDICAGRKQLRSDGTLMLTSNPDIDGLLIEGRVEPTPSLPSVLKVVAISNSVNAARSEINASKAVLFAEEQLENDPQSPPDRTVDEDWLFAWRDYAGRVSAEELQRLWGSVLAGEVKSPGRYSMRTLEFLKALTKAEADLIANLARYVISGIIVREQKLEQENIGLAYIQLLQLQEIGVVSGVEATGLTITYKSTADGTFVRVLLSNGKALLVEHEDPTRVLNLKICSLTEVGKQVLELGSFEPNLEYLRLVGKQIS